MCVDRSAGSSQRICLISAHASNACASRTFRLAKRPAIVLQARLRSPDSVLHSSDMASSQQLPLDPAVIDELAVRLSDAVVARVIEVMRTEGVIPQPRAARAWLDAGEVARHLGVSREWVYEHVDELGASRIGNGPRPRLRFPPQILDFLDGKPPSAHAPTRSADPRARPTG